MKITYKSKRLEYWIIGATVLAILAVIATFVLLFGFDEPLLPAKLLYTVQTVLFFIFLAEKLFRFFNAESKLHFLRFNWFEIPLLFLLLVDFVGAGRWFVIEHRALALQIAIAVYLALQVVSKVCFGMIQFASSGRNPSTGLVTLFIFLISAGAGLLMLPTAHTMRTMSFTDAVFTATSAACVTGLVVVDTGSDFTIIGQGIILILIQLGGLGIVVFGAVLAMMLGQSLSVRESVTMQDLLSTNTLSRIRSMIGFIFAATLLIEAVGAVLLLDMWKDNPQMDLSVRDQWFYSIFHSVSAFCNAGFSLMKNSLMGFETSPRVYTVIAPLVILGGLGFSVLFNVSHVMTDRCIRFIKGHVNPNAMLNRGIPERLRLQTKIVLAMTAALIILGMASIMLYEYHSPNPHQGSLLLNSLFQSVTARTAGFNTVDISNMSEAGKLIMMILMAIGGSPGSTTGGIKTTTIALVLVVVFSALSKRREVELFGRSVPREVVRRAISLMMMFAGMILLTTFTLVLTEQDSGWSLLDLAFEATSALGTVGLSTGVTPTLTTAGKWIIIFTMLIGRIGLLTLLAGLTFNIKPASYDYPSEPLMIG
jgi:trk system potassium uptake protein TrkH